MFITFEGPDGSGKSTQVQLLAEVLRAQNLPIFVTREPGGTTIGDQIRDVILSLKNQDMHPRSETLLFCAARAQLVEQELRPRIARGEIILCDRFADSTLAYQGYGHGNDLSTLRQLLDFATGGLKPNLTLLFDLDAEAGLRRRKSGEGEWNRLDDFQAAFHKRVRTGYLQMAAEEPARWRIIDAAGTVPAVHQKVSETVLNFLSKR